MLYVCCGEHRVQRVRNPLGQIFPDLSHHCRKAGDEDEGGQSAGLSDSPELGMPAGEPVSYTHLRAHETSAHH
eukprot:5529772-Alexandrium_andersonii.AAC.1